jgi:hypothetical protein
VPADADAIAVPDDRWHVLSADPAFKEPRDPAVKTYTKAFTAEPAALGSVQVKAGAPAQLLCVMIDLDEEPACRAEDVTEALLHALEVASKRGLAHVAVRVPGAEHGIARDDALRAIGYAVAPGGVDVTIVSDDPGDLDAL